MFASALRNAPRRVRASKLPLKLRSSSRFLSTAPPSQKSRSWKSSTARWAIAGAGIWYYNTSPMFAEQPDGAISRLDESIHKVQESNLPTIDAIVQEKHRRQATQQEQEAQAAKAQTVQDSAIDDGEEVSVEGLEEEADQQGAFNPETGEINWDCPCLGGMAHGPCGPEFKEAFSCFVHSTEEPKGMECIEKFKGMQDCFRQHPEMYGSELEGDEDEVEEELRAEASAKSDDDSDASTAPTSSLQASNAESTEPHAEVESKSSESIVATPKPSDADVAAGRKATHDATMK